MSQANQRARLIDVALGATPPDVIIRGGNLVNVHTAEIHRADILIKGERIAAIASDEEDYPLGDDTQIVEADGQYISPGFIDPHMHIESSSLTTRQFARAVVPRGTTTIVVDPHELGNVLGLRGIELLLKEAAGVPINLLLRVPARVPELPEHLETPGESISMDETSDMLQWRESACLAGDIHPNLILGKDPAQLEKIGYTIRAGKTVSGYSPGLRGRDLNALLAAGLEDSHTPKDVEELLDDLRHGLHVLLTPRPFKFEEGEFTALADLLREEHIDTRMLSFCTDDVHTNQLISEGHLDHRLRIAISRGLDPITAIQMATINTAALLRMRRDLGSIAPGKLADIVLLSDLEDVRADKVFVHGQLVAEHGAMVATPEPFTYPQWSLDTIHIGPPIKAEDLPLRVSADRGEVRAKMILPGSPKECTVGSLRVEGGIVLPDQDADVQAVAVIDRHRASGHIGRGFIHGFGIRDGAMATSINHNAHNLMVIGTDFDSMAVAINRLVDIGGGYVAVKKGQVAAEVALPISGLLSDEDLEVVAAKFTAIERVLKEDLGCTIDNRPLWTLNFICSPVVPYWGITDKGLINARTMELEDVIVEDA